jgi:hypothetical protein
MHATRPLEAEPAATTQDGVIDRGELTPWLGVDSSKRPSVEAAVTGRRRTRDAAVGVKLHAEIGAGARARDVCMSDRSS